MGGVAASIAGGAVSGLLGRSSSKRGGSSSGTQRRVTKLQPAVPIDISTDFGARLVRRPGGRVFLDTTAASKLPTAARDLRFRELQGINEDVKRDINTLRSLENPFVRARVRPTEERVGRALASAGRGLARRGVQGTLANNELFRLNTLGGREIADQTALATADVQNAIANRQVLQQGVLRGIQDVGESQLRQIFAELGLALDSERLFLASRAQSAGEETVTSSGTTSGRQTDQGSPTGLGNLLTAGADLLFGGGGGGGSSIQNAGLRTFGFA